MTLFEFMEYEGLTLTVHSDGSAEFEHSRRVDQLQDVPLPEHTFILNNVRVLTPSCHEAERIDEDGKSYALVDGERTNRGDT